MRQCCPSPYSHTQYLLMVLPQAARNLQPLYSLSTTSFVHPDRLVFSFHATRWFEADTGAAGGACRGAPISKDLFCCMRNTAVQPSRAPIVRDPTASYTAWPVRWTAHIDAPAATHITEQRSDANNWHIRWHSLPRSDPPRLHKLACCMRHEFTLIHIPTQHLLLSSKFLGLKADPGLSPLEPGTSPSLRMSRTC